MSCTRKSLNNLIESTWKVQNAKATIEREKTSRMQVLKHSGLISCADGSDMEWYTCSPNILQKYLTFVIFYIYPDAIRDTLIHGYSKFRNIRITGLANCGKNFMLKPLETIYNEFNNEGNEKYAWVVEEHAELIILQDFRWSIELI